MRETSKGVGELAARMSRTLADIDALSGTESAATAGELRAILAEYAGEARALAGLGAVPCPCGPCEAARSRPISPLSQVTNDPRSATLDPDGPEAEENVGDDGAGFPSMTAAERAEYLGEPREFPCDVRECPCAAEWETTGGVATVARFCARHFSAAAAARENAGTEFRNVLSGRRVSALA